MAEKISVEIGLEGGAEVQRQLEDIGKSGQKAFSDIQGAAEQLDFTTISDGFQQIGETGVQAFDKVKAAAQNAAVFEQIITGVRKVEGAFESLSTAATKMASRMTRSLGPIGVFARALGPLGIALGVVGGAVVKFGDDTADAINKLTAESAKLGLTAQQLDRLQQAFTRLGVASDAIVPGLQKFRESLGEDFTGNVTAALQQFIAQLERMPDGVQRTQLAMARLGDSLGAQVIAGLQTGAISAQNFATALGLVTPATQQQIVEAAKYQQALNQMNAAWTSFKSAVSTPLTPVLQFITQEIQSLDAGFRGVLSTYQTFKAMLSQDFDIPWMLKFINFDPNLMLSKWLPVLQLIQNALGQGTWPALDALVLKAQQAAQALQQTAQAGTQAGQQVAQAGQTAVQAWQQGQLAVGPFGQSLALTGEAGTQAGQQIAAGMSTANQALQSTATQANATTQAVQQVQPPESSSWTSWASTVIGALQGAINKLLEWIGLQSKAGAGGGGGGGGGAAGKARGGLIGGRGTGTSDSNLAWLSRGEFVMRAAAVRQFGASFFAALNAGRIPGFQGGGGFGFEVAPFAPMPGGDVSSFFGEIKQTTDDILQQINSLAQINNTLVQAIQGLIQKVDGLVQSVDSSNQTLDTLTRKIDSAIQTFNTVVQKAIDGLTQTVNGLLQLVNTLIQKIDVTADKQGQNRLLDEVSALTQSIRDLMQSQKNTEGEVRRAATGQQTENDLIKRELQQQRELLRDASQRLIYGYASGGLLGGRGSGSSDSNLAWLSRGEFVIRAAAVRKFGSAFFAALNAGMIPGFALGGLVPRPAFASGGPVGSMSNVTIQFPGVPPVSGLRASSAVVEELQRSAALAQVRSGGRKPSRYS